MIDCLIFSRNRAAQLDLLLDSIERYSQHLYHRVWVLYRADSRSYAFAYANCEQDHSWALFRNEHNFNHDVREWLLVKDDAPITFLVDDDVFYRHASILHKSPETFFGNRLPLPYSFRAGDYDYPWSLDGCIYTREMILDRLPPYFSNPTELEAGMAEYNVERFEGVYPCLVGIPANRVSPSSGMPHMDIDPFELNERYLKGDRLSLNKTLENVEVNAAHMAIPLRWRSEGR